VKTKLWENFARVTGEAGYFCVSMLAQFVFFFLLEDQCLSRGKVQGHDIRRALSLFIGLSSPFLSLFFLPVVFFLSVMTGELNLTMKPSVVRFPCFYLKSCAILMFKSSKVDCE